MLLIWETFGRTMKIFDKLLGKFVRAIAAGIVDEIEQRELVDHEELTKKKILADRAANQLHWSGILRTALQSAQETQTMISPAMKAVIDRMESEANEYKAKNNL